MRKLGADEQGSDRRPTERVELAQHTKGKAICQLEVPPKGNERSESGVVWDSWLTLVSHGGPDSAWVILSAAEKEE